MKKKVHFAHAQTFLFNGIFIALTSGIFLNDYLLRIGYQPHDFGIFYAFVYMSGLVAFPVLSFVSSAERKKMMYLIFLCVSLCFFMIFAAVPYVFEPGSRLVIWFSNVAICLCYTAMRIGHLTLVPWLYDIVGNEKWIKFFFIRSIINYIIPAAITFAFGGLLEIEGISIMTTLFLVALIVAFLGVACMLLFPEGNSESREFPLRRALPDVIKGLSLNRNATLLVLYCILFYCGIGVIIPSVYPYLADHMGIENTVIYKYQVLMLVTSLVSIIGASWLSKRKDSITVLFWLSSLMWLVPIMLLLLPISKYFFSGLIYVLGVEYGYGLVFAGVYATLTTVSLQYIPKADHVVFTAGLDFIRSVFMSLGALTFGWAIKQFHSYEPLFMVSLVMLLAAALILKRLQVQQQQHQ